MSLKYVYEKKEWIKLSTSVRSEQGLSDLFQARRFRKDREKEYNSFDLSRAEAPYYLESIAEELKFRSRAIRHQVYEIGMLLVEAKKIVRHGEFDEWLKHSTDISKSTALNCMGVYKICMGSPELVEYFDTSALYVICRPSFPKTLRDILFSNAEGVYDISCKELLEVAFSWQKGKINLGSPQVQELLRKQKRQSLWKRYEIETMAIMHTLKRKQEKIREITNEHSVSPLRDEDIRDNKY